MKIAAIFFLCIFAYVHSLALLTLFNVEWSSFKYIYRKSYQSAHEEIKRMRIYSENSENIMKHNYLHSIGVVPYKQTMNQFGDMRTKEFGSMLNGLRPKFQLDFGISANTGATFIPPANVKLPDHVDWRTQGAVTEVKDQKNCGSCWSFASTGSLEGQHFRKTGKLVSLSEQNLIDCSESFGNHGCEGGLMTNAYNYIKSNKGIDTEESYPYVAADLDCEYNASYSGATDRGFVAIESGNEEALKSAVATIGPISVGIDASHSSFQFYKKGIYDEPECKSMLLDHGVLVVGYGTTKEGVDYWIVKNSWGPKWGDNGYILMSRSKHNQCGIASMATYPLV